VTPLQKENVKKDKITISEQEISKSSFLALLARLSENHEKD